MIPLLLFATLCGSVAALLAVRSGQRAHGRWQRLDRAGAWLVGSVAVLLAVAAFVEPGRDLLGFAMPERCRGKAHSRPPTGEEHADVEALKAEVRHRRFELTHARPSMRATGTQEMAQLTGPGSANRTDDRWNVFGTDLGHPVVHQDRLGLVFGDTFGDADRNDWRSNVMAWATRPEPDELVFTDMPGSDGRARELIGSLKLRGWEQTTIPTNAVSVGDRLVVHYMSVVCWGPAGSWVADHAGLAVSDDGGLRFSRSAGPRWDGDGGFVQVAFVDDGDHLYAFGIPAGRSGAARLARVEPERITQTSAWRYWDGHRWSDEAADAIPLVGAPVGELSVQWNPRYERWLMMYLHEGRGGIVLRTAEQLTGPWSGAELVASGLEFPQLYGPYLLPVIGDGGVAYFTMSRFDVYNVFLMRAHLVPAPTLVPAVPY